MKRLKLIFSLVVVLSLASFKADAQYYFYNDEYYDNDVIFEVGGSLSAMNCLTDLGGKKGIGKRFLKDLNTGKTHVAAGVFFSAMYRNAIGVRLEGTFGKLSADDAVLTGITDIAKERFNRNLNFRTTITEGVLLAEIHPLFIINNYAESDQYPPRISPYLLAGVGYFSYNPQGRVPNSNTWVDLQPLSTEGQGFPEYPNSKPYKLQQMNIPIGLGFKYEINPLFNLRLEGLYRILNTDYLDDVSTNYVTPESFQANFTPTKAALAYAMSDKQLVKRVNTIGGKGKRGSAAEKDAYFSLNLKLSLVLGRQKIR